MAAPKKLMVVNRKAPHGTIYALEALEQVLIAAAFGQQVSIAFLDDGVYQLVRNQNTGDIGTKNFSPAFRALEDYDVKTLYVEHESLGLRGLTAADLLVSVTVLAATELAARMAEQDVILSS